MVTIDGPTSHIVLLVLNQKHMSIPKVTIQPVYCNLM